jgi:ammonium transporter, Amt family
VTLPGFPESATAFCLFLIMLVPLGSAGLALINTGLGRSRSAAHAVLAALSVVAVAAIVHVLWGFSLEGFLGRPGHLIVAGGKTWNWVAKEPFFLRGVEFDGSPVSLSILLQMFGVGLAALIPLSAGADRWRLGASSVSTVLLAGIVYPLFAHWVWGGGWLEQLGVNYQLGRGFVDGGGASCIQAVGGLTALSIAWILGPRRGKYSHDGMPAAIPGHNAVFVLFGGLLAWLGWMGLNSAGAILFAAAEPARAVLVAINTTVSAASAALTAAAITRRRFGRPDATLSANGWLAGLVASSASAPFVTPAAAILVGTVAGAVTLLAIEGFEFCLAVDDPGGAISVHAVSGIWSLVAVALFADFPNQAGKSRQWLAQLVGVASLLGFVLPLTYGLNWLLNRFYPQRVDLEGERQGMDLHELGAGAYPEFVVHSDELIQR